MDSLVRRAFELHSASGIAQKLLELMGNDEYSVEEVRNCVEKDPALTVRVLATVNSARYGTGRSVGSLEQAVAMLGRQKLRTIVLAFSVIEGLTRGVDAGIYADYWKRSITTSLVAEALARTRQAAAKNDAYTAGLLVDIGVLVLAQFESDKYLSAFEQNEHGPALVEAEREIFGFDHAALGAKMLEAWSFPADLVTAVAAHHDSERADVHALASFVRAGNLLPAAIWSADREAIHVAYDYAASRFDLTIDQFISLVVDVNDYVEEEAKTYGVEGLKGVDCEALQKEARELLQSSNVPAP